MKKFILLLLALILLSQSINAQNIGISDVAITPDASAMLEVKASNKGLLIPRVSLSSTTDNTTIESPATSLLVYNTATAGTAPNNVTPGYYYWTGSKWMRLLAVDDKVAWLLTGNSGTTPATNFLGTTDAQPLVIKTNNAERSRILSNGQVLINRTAADYSGDLLEVQGNSTYPFAINGFTDQASGAGVYGYNSASSGTGVVGAGNNQTANVLTNGSGGAFTGDSIGVYGSATKSGNGTFGGYFTHGGSAYAYVGGRFGLTNYKINGKGIVSTIVKNTAGERVNLYCPEAPEIYFQDYGEGQLVNGKAHIELDPDFAINVIINEKHPLRVFIQLEDDCYGVYVTNKTKTGFDVIELNGGKSNAKFMWTVTANRADEVDENGNIISKYADVRFGPAPGPLESIEAKEEKANKETTNYLKDIKEIKEVKSLDKNNININKTNNQ